jgi:hypothetical protein
LTRKGVWRRRWAGRTGREGKRFGWFRLGFGDRSGKERGWFVGVGSRGGDIDRKI